MTLSTSWWYALLSVLEHNFPMSADIVAFTVFGEAMIAYVRPLFLTVCVLLIGKQIWDFL